MEGEEEEMDKLEAIVKMLPGATAIDMKEVLSACPLCAQNNRTGSLKRFNVSIEESSILCDNDLCWYTGDEDLNSDPASTSLDISGSMQVDDLSSLTALDTFLNESVTNNTDSDSLAENIGSNACSANISTPLKTQHQSSQLPKSQTETKLQIAPKHSSITVKHTEHRELVNNSDQKVLDPYRMLWANTDALCWLDVLLGFLCFNTSVRTAAKNLSYSSMVKKLLVAYDEAQALLEPLQKGDNHILHSVMAQEKLPRTIKLGGGFNSPFTDLFKELMEVEPQRYSTKDMCSAQRKIHLADLKMEAVREEIWQVIEPALKCQRGKDDSPVFAFPLILGTDEKVMSLFETPHTWTTMCDKCGNSDSISGKKPMITFPKVAEEFVMYTNMVHIRSCIQCGAEGQKRELTLDKCMDNLAIHFADGLPNSDVDSLSFTLGNGAKYVVVAVIEYKTSPNHFALWQKEQALDKAEKWMIYDDLRSQYANFSTKEFTAPSNNIHVVFWEKLHIPKSSKPASILPDLSSKFPKSASILPDDASSSDESFIEVPSSKTIVAKKKRKPAPVKRKCKTVDMDSFESAMEQLNAFSPEKKSRMDDRHSKTPALPKNSVSHISANFPKQKLPVQKVINMPDSESSTPKPNILKQAIAKPKPTLPAPNQDKNTLNSSSSITPVAKSKTPRTSVSSANAKPVTSKAVTNTSIPNNTSAKPSTTNQSSKRRTPKDKEKQSASQASTGPGLSNSAKQKTQTSVCTNKPTITTVTSQQSNGQPSTAPQAVPHVTNMNQAEASSDLCSSSPNIIDMLESFSSYPQQSQQPATVAVASAKPPTSQQTSKPRQLKLLSKKITATARTESYKQAPVRGSQPSQPVSNGSYSAIMDTLAGVNKRKSSDSIARSVNKPQIAARITTPSAPKVKKSCLDLVQPLLIKSKLEKQKMLSGYVPKNERPEASPARKKVKFDALAAPAKKAKSSAKKETKTKTSSKKNPASLVAASVNSIPAANNSHQHSPHVPAQICASYTSAISYPQKQTNIDAATWQTNNHSSHQSANQSYANPQPYMNGFDQNAHSNPHGSSGQVDNDDSYISSMLSFLDAPLPESQDMPSLDDMFSEFL